MRSSPASPFSAFVEGEGIVILDGGLATALEEQGHDLGGGLWSARLVIEEPEAVRAVHLAYLEAGADCVTTASYQASLPGLAERGLTAGEAEAVLRRCSELALSARDAYWQRQAPRAGRRARPLVAASVGPYGAYLADGSEYVGAYDVSRSDLHDFHRRRFRVLASSGADIMACETIPSAEEARVLLQILDGTADVWAWFSFTCRDGSRLSDGSDFGEIVSECASHERVAAVGVNCTAPRWIPELIERARGVTDLPLVAYPNSGEVYEAASGVWLDPNSAAVGDWHEHMRLARSAGAVVVGGCCRVGFGEIGRLRRDLSGRRMADEP